MGIYLGAVPADRAATIWAWEARNGNDGPYGIRDVYPYISFGPDPGFYGNGGVCELCVVCYSAFSLLPTC